MKAAFSLFCYASVAQLDRALDSDSKGRRFEFCQAHQKKAPFLAHAGKGAFFYFSGAFALFFCISHDPIALKQPAVFPRGAPALPPKALGVIALARKTDRLGHLRD